MYVGIFFCFMLYKWTLRNKEYQLLIPFNWETLSYTKQNHERAPEREAGDKPPPLQFKKKCHIPWFLLLVCVRAYVRFEMKEIPR